MAIPGDSASGLSEPSIDAVVASMQERLD